MRDCLRRSNLIKFPYLPLSVSLCIARDALAYNYKAAARLRCSRRGLRSLFLSLSRKRA